jgi:Flp pilus assembly protein TadG
MRYSVCRSGARGAGRGSRKDRGGIAAVEFVVCMPVLVTFMLGVWEVGRLAEVANVMWNGAREAARDASTGQDNLNTVAANLANYLQSAEPTAFNQGHGTTLTLLSPPTLPANTYGYKCTDNVSNVELFTMTFTDVTTPTATDTTGMNKLDHYQITIQAPYSTIGWTAVAEITGATRFSVTVDWACMKDTPFTVNGYLPAQ